MPNLNFVANVVDAETGKYVNGFEYDGDGTIHFSTAAQGPEFAMNLANQDLMRRNLPLSAMAPVTTITLGGVAWGGGGTNAVAATGVLTATGLPTADQTVTIGTAGAAKVYTWKNTVASTANQVLINQGVKATGTLTFTGQPDSGQQVVINDITYTFLTVLIDAPGNVAIGGSAALSVANLYAAATGGAGAGTAYGTGTAAPANVVVTTPSALVILVTAAAIGTAANSYVTTTDVTGAAWTAATLTGGAAQSVQTTLANLAAAINAGAGSGTAYGSATTAHTKVTATSGATTLTATAIIPGAAGNAEATTDTSSNMSWGAATLAGGADASA